MALNFLFFSLALLILAVTGGVFVWVVRFTLDTHYDWQQFKRQQIAHFTQAADVDAK